GRLDQRERGAGAQDVTKRRLDHQRVRGAHGIEAARLAGLVTRDQVDDGLHAKSLAALARRSAATVCSYVTECASISPNPPNRAVWSWRAKAPTIPALRLRPAGARSSSCWPARSQVPA